MAYFNSHISTIDYNSVSSEEFNKFNTYFIADVKKSRGADIVKNAGGILGNYKINLYYDEERTQLCSTFTYIVKDKSMYRATPEKTLENGNKVNETKVKIARNVVVFNAEIPSDPSTTNNKNVIDVTIGTGTSITKPNFGKTIRYVLKYW